MPRKSTGWIWYLVILAVLTVASIATLTTFNLRQQLTLEQLAAAQALWQEKGPADYDLEYTQQVSETEKFFVRVRGGKVVHVERNGKPLEVELYRYHSMPALFSFLDGFLRHDAGPGKPRTYMVAKFAVEDGHLERFVRSVMATRERVEITVQLKRLDGAGSKK